jgi:indole-3-glycerol phosphate synthase
VAVIAELKRSSPSKGAINTGLDAGGQAAAYAAGGAAALSVLTEPTRFGGRPEDVTAALTATARRVPVLRKDFLVDPLQLVEARALGASAALLIARALPPAELRAMEQAARDLGLETLVEVRDERELDAALAADARVIGVNNRDLESLVIDLATGERLVPRIPADCVAVFESGVNGPVEVDRAARAGADAVLVGSSVSAAADPAAAVGRLAAVPRVGRPAPG